MSNQSSGYNNHGFSTNFYDLYNYEYVPEIDPDSPENKINKRKNTPWKGQKIESEGLIHQNESDDSDRSVIVEERNNRRVTLFCEKRPVQDPDGGYSHNISMESSDDENQLMKRRAIIQKAPSRQLERDLGVKQFEDKNFEDYDQSSHRYAEIDELELEGVYFEPKPPALPPKPKTLSPITLNSNNLCSSSPIDYLEMTDFSPPNTQSLTKRADDSMFHTPVKRDTPHTTPQNAATIFLVDRQEEAKQTKSEPKRTRRNIFEYPYKSTTEPVNPRTTAVISPILHRKTSQLTDFERMSRRAQSTGNLRQPIQKNNMTEPPVELNLTYKRKPKGFSPNLSRMRGVLCEEENTEQLEGLDALTEFTNMDSPARSWISFERDDLPAFSTQCIFCSAVLQFLAGIAVIATAFFLISKIHRHIFLDLAILVGFINISLGALGFRPYYRRWLPTRHFVSGYITLAVLALMSVGILLHLVVLRPTTNEPFYGALQGLSIIMSVIIIAVALTGFLLSHCRTTRWKKRNISVVF